MKGLLHRLADRAAGAAVLVRPDVRRVGIDRPGADFTSEPASERGVPRLVDDARGDEERASVNDSVPQAGLRATQLTERRSPSLPIGKARLEGDAGIRPLDRTPGHLAHSASVAPLRTDNEPSPRGPRSLAPQDATAPQSLQSESTVREPRALAASPAATRPHSPPAPLLPSVPDSGLRHGIGEANARNAQVATRVAMQQVTAQAAPDSTEVHIHIGRIEVTAIQDSPRPLPRKPAAGSPAPMSLDDYLARRGGP